LDYRYEKKYFLSAETAAVLKRRIAAALPPDSHSGGIYRVNNVYFDDFNLSFYNQKENGAYNRDKYRLRFYNNNLSFIRLERKHKDGELSYKESAQVSAALFKALVNGEADFAQKFPEVLSDSKHAVFWSNFINLYRLRRLKPTAQFSYIREAYFHKTANVRITFDSCIGGNSKDISGVLEVKYTHFIPRFISGLLNGANLTHTEMSKYCMVLNREAKLNVKFH
jgi:hypothetical protein